MQPSLNQPQPLHAGTHVPADDDVIVHGDAEWSGEFDDRPGHPDIRVRPRGILFYFGDKTLRMNDVSGVTLDIIEPLALLMPRSTEARWLADLTSKGPPHLRRPFVPSWDGADPFQQRAVEPVQQ